MFKCKIYSKNKNFKKMNSNLNLLPNLIPVQDQSHGNSNTFIYKGFIDIFVN